MAKLRRKSVPYKVSQTGLFHGKMRRTGHSISHSEHHHKRTFYPAVHKKRVLSDILGEMIKMKVTTKALKVMKKVRSVALSCEMSEH
jgi:large subunit ribosomal protein L28